MTPREREAQIEAWQHSVAERLMHIHSSMDTLRKLYDERTGLRPSFNTMVGLSSTVSWSLDYRGRKYVYIFSAQTLSLSLEDLGNLNVAAGMWVNISFRAGTIILATGQSNLIYVAVKQTDDPLPPTPGTIVSAVAAALATPSSNPTQTANAAADTTFKFGANGTTQFNHCSIQNNTNANVIYAFDQDSTKAGDAIYVLTAGQLVKWDRAGTILHFNTAAQQNFGGTSGITVEAFA
jgi:hypothetical protein